MERTQRRIARACCSHRADFSYAWDADASGRRDRVSPSRCASNGRRIESGARYRVTVNDFLASGGDGFSVLRDGTDRSRGPLDIDALTEYLRRSRRRSRSPPDPQARIRRAD